MRTKNNRRNSSMELLRIISMLLVMIVHASFLSLGVPSNGDCMNNPGISIFRFSVESLSVVCVDVFVLLSGYYGIKWHKERITSLIFQVFFFSILVFLSVGSFSSLELFNLQGVSHLFLLNSSDYWFVKSYLILYLFAPLLNSFVETGSSRNLKFFILFFFLIQTIYGWMSIYGIADFCGGYSALSFMGLYVLIRYLRYHYDFQLKSVSWQKYLLVYFLVTIIQAIVAFFITVNNFPVAGRLFTYTNPLVILQAFALLMTFANIKPFFNKTINWVSSSCLAVYLLHGNELFLRPIFGLKIRAWFNDLPFSIFLMKTSLFICLLYFSAILIDKIQMLIWNKLLRRILNIKSF